MLEQLIKTAQIKEFVESERMTVYEASFNFERNNVPEYEYYKKIIESISSRDELEFTIQDEINNVFDLLSGNLEEYQSYIKDSLNDMIFNVKIQIDKNLINNHLSIYSFQKFVDDILSLELDEVMMSFSSIFNSSEEYIIFDVYDGITTFTTKTMFFIPSNPVDEIKIDIDYNFNRNQRIQECKEISYFYNFDRYELLPDDFKINFNFKDNPLTELFKKITTILSMCFLASSSTINGNLIKGVINGQRTIDYSCDYGKLSNNSVLYNVYNWIYTDGNPIDKAIIARNVISLHCRNISVMKIDDKVFASIQSNYNLYLKANVKEYLALKNKVSEFISETVSKTGEYAMEMLDKFKSNLLAIFGFLFTIVLANVVSDQPLDNIFTQDILTLLKIILFGSFLYLCICAVQFRFQINKVQESYKQLKLNYTDILAEDDIHDIFKNDEIINKMLKTINTHKWIYLIIWFFLLVLAYIVVEMLSYNITRTVIIDFLCHVISLFRK